MATTAKTESNTGTATTTNATTVTISDVLQALHANLPNLVANTNYTLPQLVGNTFWYAIPQQGMRSQLGVAFKKLVNNGGQPVKWIKRRGDNNHLYQLN
jgi:hypothetical protein